MSSKRRHVSTNIFTKEAENPERDERIAEVLYDLKDTKNKSASIRKSIAVEACMDLLNKANLYSTQNVVKLNENLSETMPDANGSLQKQETQQTQQHLSFLNNKRHNLVPKRICC